MGQDFGLGSQNPVLDSGDKLFEGGVRMGGWWWCCRPGYGEMDVGVFFGQPVDAGRRQLGRAGYDEISGAAQAAGYHLSMQRNF
jgi:hypothetical protein